MDSHSGLRAGLLIAFRILDAPRGFDVVAVASCLVSALYRDFWQGTFGMFGLVLGDSLVDSWLPAFLCMNPKVGWTFVRNLMVVLTSKETFLSVFQCIVQLPLGRPGDVVGTRRLSKDPEVVWEPGGPSDPEVVFRTRKSFGNPEVPSDPEVIFRTWRLFGNAEVPSDPETLRDVLVMGVKTQVPDFTAFHVRSSSQVLPVCQYSGTYIASPVLYSMESFNTGLRRPIPALSLIPIFSLPGVMDRSTVRSRSRNFFMREFEDWGPTRENLKTWAWAMLEPEGESFFHMIDRGLDKYSQVLDMFEGDLVGFEALDLVSRWTTRFALRSSNLCRSLPVMQVVTKMDLPSL
ncbi:hypothetical protein F2Q68_00034221 [Brassica cretica]|uniref:Uncharacterized protein n=1 Tax=Brassica cretica TaxID=69181 RepID=A0A8S9H132_BRACR|nr:hypothetical protein F2Q68_00034221 [Brassica cretica]